MTSRDLYALSSRLKELARKYTGEDEQRALYRVQQIVDREVKELNKRALARRRLKSSNG